MTTQTKKADDKAADIKPAKSFEPSGAPNQVPGVDPNDPALDANPREGTTADQNRIDLNDPSKSDADAVAENLGLKTEKAD